MSNVRVEQSDYVRFYLKSQNKESRLVNPLNWSEDSQNFVRNLDYHGILIEYTDGLEFYGDDLIYIEEDFKTYGLTSKMYLVKTVLEDVDDEVKWVIDYIGYVDYKTRTLKDGKVSINFNSNDLERLIESYESTDFEIERLKSVKDTILEEMETDLINIKGRTLFTSGVLALRKDGIDITFDQQEFNIVQFRGSYQRIPISNSFNINDPAYSYRLATPHTYKQVEGHPRMSTADITGFDYGTGLIDLASKMFFVDSATVSPNYSSSILENVRGNIFFDVEIEGHVGMWFDVQLIKYRRFNGEYHRSSTTTIFRTQLQRDRGFGDGLRATMSYDYNYDNINYDEGLMLAYTASAPYSSDPNNMNLNVFEQIITVDVDSVFEPSTDLKFAFVHDIVERLLYIMSGAKNKLRSFTFGRTELNRYDADGEFGLIGLISGFWLRDFSPESELYKSLTVSFKRLIDDLKIVFNVGIGIELIDNVQKLVIEDLDYFYQDRTVIRLGKVTDINRKTIGNDYFSSVETGFNKGGDYENELGLDEPNTKTSRTTPIDNSKAKYSKVSDTRADDTGMEITRRKPEEFFPKEDTQMDLHNWFLDCKRDLNGRFTQKDWTDRLDEAPTGITFPDDFRGFFFTPLRILLRHGKQIRSGLEQAINMTKKILFASSTGNSNLKMKFTGDTVAYREDGDILIKNLSRAKILPEEITFKKAVSEDLAKLIKGKTSIYYQGAFREIPNYYFKVEFINDFDELEYGYIWEAKPKSGEFKLLKSNEQIL